MTVATSTAPLTRERQELASRFGFKTRIIRNVQLAELKPAVQTRTRYEFPEKTLTQWVTQIKGGANFPLPVITEDKGIVCGKTTVEAYKRAGRTSYDCILLCDTYYVGANPKLLADLSLLDTFSNQMNGQRMDEDELLHQVRNAMDRGIEPDELARNLGVPLRRITNQMKVVRSERRIEALKLSPEITDELTKTHYSALGRVDSLNDAPYIELLRLTGEAQLRVHEIDRLAAAMRKTRSDAAAIRIVKQARDEEYLSRIRERALRGSGKGNRRPRSDWELLSLHLAGVRALRDRVDTVFYPEPTGNEQFRQHALSAIQESIEILRKLEVSIGE